MCIKFLRATNFTSTFYLGGAVYSHYGQDSCDGSEVEEMVETLTSVKGTYGNNNLMIYRVYSGETPISNVHYLEIKAQ